MLGLGANLQLIIALVSTFPTFIQEPLLALFIVLDILATICMHNTNILFLLMVEQPIFLTMWLIIDYINDAQLIRFFVLGVITHLIIIENTILVNCL